MVKTKIFTILRRRIMLPLVFMMLSTGLHAQTVFPGGNYWSFDAGFGMTDILVKGLSYQFVVDPKIWISPPLMIGNRIGANYSTDKLLAFENQIYLRWNFLRPGRPEKAVNIFVQGGAGLLAAYKGGENGLFSDAAKTRGSFMLDAAVGVTIPLTSTWHIEPMVHGGYPHIAGFSITIGRKIPFKAAEKSKYPSTVECVMFGADIGQYNVDIDNGIQKLNETVLNDIAKALKKNPNYRVRIEGHANPVLNNPSENNRLMNLSKVRADTVAGQLKARGVNENQMVIIAFGGTRPATCDQSCCNKNRRVELIVFKDTIE